LVLAQSWAVRRWALKRFAKVEDYLNALKPIVLGIVESETPYLNGVAAMVMSRKEDEPVRPERGTLS
jgi:hypothetical protein